MNNLDTMLEESLAGFCAAHSDIVEAAQDYTFLRRRNRKIGKTALISGGGAGHEPLHIGFVGYGMLDAACPGQIFTSPTPDQIVAAANAVNGGSGCLFIVKNYDGDIMNFDMALEMFGSSAGCIVVSDEVAAGSNHRRGVAGTLVIEKILGAGAEAGIDLADLLQIGERVNQQTRSMGAALTSCTVPAIGRPTFALGQDQMELGVGIHGEPGRRRMQLASADAIAEELLAAILSDLNLEPGKETLLLVNGFGGTPSMELYLMFNSARRILAGKGITVARSLIGNFVTSLDMVGCSLTVSALDAQAKQLWDAPVHAPALRWGM